MLGKMYMDSACIEQAFDPVSYRTPEYEFIIVRGEDVCGVCC